MEDLTAEVFGIHKQVDILINNAGVDVSGSVVDLSYEDLEWITRINYWGIVYGTKCFLPHFLKRKTGLVANMSSLLGLIGVPMQGAYSATKFAIRGFTESLQLELKATGARAVCVHPGGVKTCLMANARFYGDYDGSRSKEEALRRFERLTPTRADRAARCIVRGIKKGKNRIVVGPDARLFDWVQRLLPAHYHRIRVALHRLR